MFSKERRKGRIRRRARKLFSAWAWEVMPRHKRSKYFGADEVEIRGKNELHLLQIRGGGGCHHPLHLFRREGAPIGKSRVARRVAKVTISVKNGELPFCVSTLTVQQARPLLEGEEIKNKKNRPYPSEGGWGHEREGHHFPGLRNNKYFIIGGK